MPAHVAGGGPGADPLQEAFDRCGALQCGFCQSGMISRPARCWPRNRAPTRERDARRPWPATCAAARATRRSSRPWHWPWPRPRGRRRLRGPGRRPRPGRARSAEWPRATSTASSRPGASSGTSVGHSRKVDGLPRPPAPRSTPTTSRCRACCTPRPCAARTRTRASARSTPRRRCGCPGVLAVITGAGPAREVRHPALDPGRDRAGRGQGPLRRRPGGRGRGDRRGHGQRGPQADPGRLRAAARLPAILPRAWRATTRPSTRTARTGNVSKHVELAFGDVEAGAGAGRDRRGGRLLLPRHDPRGHRAALRLGALRRRRPADASGRRPRSRTTCTAPWRACWGCPPTASA